MNDPIVITGIGLITAVGGDREETWQSVCRGVSGVRRLRDLPGLPDDMMLAATVAGFPQQGGSSRNGPIALAAAREAIADSGLDLAAMDRTRVGTSISANFGNSPGVEAVRIKQCGLSLGGRWWNEFLPCSTGAHVASELALQGPRLCNGTACASSTIALLTAVRAIQDGQCDVALTGAVQTIHPLLAAGFHNMRVLAQHERPTEACRPFDANRTGFVMGEGSAFLTVERLSGALARGAEIYAEVAGGGMLSDAHHVTDLSTDSTSLVHLIRRTLKQSRLSPRDIGYVNAHGTGTLQNDVMEAHGIRTAFGKDADRTCVSSVKANLGHLVTSAGAAELAITAMALRDGYAPPTINLTQPDPQCDLDCLPLVGRRQPLEHSLKLSIAFGGNLAAVALRRWSGVGERRASDPMPIARAA